MNKSFTEVAQPMAEGLNDSNFKRYVGFVYPAVILLVMLTRTLPILFEQGWSPAQWVVFPLMVLFLLVTASLVMIKPEQGMRLVRWVVWLMLPAFSFGLLTMIHTPLVMLPGGFLMAAYLLEAKERHLYLYTGLVLLLTVVIYRFEGAELVFGLRSLSATALGYLVFLRILTFGSTGEEQRYQRLRDFIGAIAGLAVLVVPVYAFFTPGIEFGDVMGTLMAAVLFIGHSVYSNFSSGSSLRAPVFLLLFWPITLYEVMTNHEAGMLFLPAAAVAVYFVAPVRMARIFMLTLLVLVYAAISQFIGIDKLELFPRLLVMAVLSWLVVDRVALNRTKSLHQDDSNRMASLVMNTRKEVWVRAALITVLLSSLVAMVMVPFIQHIDRTRYEDQLKSAYTDLEQNVHHFERDLLRFASDLNLLALGELGRQYITSPSVSMRHLLQRQLVSLIENEPSLHQVRLLAKDGFELVRVEHIENGDAIEVPVLKLQDKSSRSYFKETFALGLGEFFISEIDLNEEQGVVEVPHRPALRIATPAFDMLGNKQGVWVKNFDARGVLKRYAIYDPHRKEQNFLLNSNGTMAMAPEGYDLWADSLGGSLKRFSDYFPDAWQQIERNREGVYQFGEQVVFYKRVNFAKKITADLEAEFGRSVTRSAAFTELMKHRDTIFVQILPRSELTQFNLLGSPVAIFWLILTLVLILIVAFSIAALMVRSEELKLQHKRLQKSTDQLKDALRLAEQAGEAKGQFLAMMSHEIRTPLNGVLGMILLAKEESREAEVKRQLALVESSANALRAIVDDVLDLSRLEQGAIDLEKRRFNPAELVNEIQNLFNPLAGQKDVVLATEIDEKSFQLIGDQHRIKQVLSNLVGNALKFTEQGRVTIHSKFETDLSDNVVWRISVRDTGIGMSDVQVSGLFERFSQADASITRRYGGSGLGLSISKQLAELMGADITVTSEEGVGSEFTLSLSLQVAEKAEAALDDTELDPFTMVSELAGKQLLVVDDSPTNRMVAQGLLKRMGLVSDAADGGASALEYLRTNTPDLILLDIHMPEMDGLAVARAIRAGEAGAACQTVPIVALTAAAFQSDKDNAISAGMDGFLSKPINALELAKELLNKLAK